MEGAIASKSGGGIQNCLVGRVLREETSNYCFCSLFFFAKTEPPFALILALFGLNMKYLLLITHPRLSILLETLLFMAESNKTQTFT